MSEAEQQDADQDALIEAAEERAVWAREYLEYQLGLLPTTPDPKLITFLQDNASFEVLVRHDLLAVALVAIGLPNKDGANLHKAHEESDPVKHAKLVGKLRKYRLTVSATHLQIANHVGEVTCEITLPLEEVRLRDPRVSYSIDLHHISLAGISGVQAISAVNGKVSPKKSRLYKDHPPIRLAYFPDVNCAELTAGNGCYRIEAMPVQKDLALEEPASANDWQQFNSKAFARAFRVLRACMGSARESAAQQVWFDRTTAVTADRQAMGRFKDTELLASAPLAVERRHLDLLATVFTNRFTGTPAYAVHGQRMIVHDNLLRCSCPAVIGEDGLPEYPFDAREGAQSYRIQRMPLTRGADGLRAITADDSVQFIGLTPTDDFEAALEGEELKLILGSGIDNFRDVRGAQMMLTMRFGPNTGWSRVELQPIGSRTSAMVVTRRVSSDRFIAATSVHSEPILEMHFLDNCLILESFRDQETCTYILAYVRDI